MTAQRLQKTKLLIIKTNTCIVYRSSTTQMTEVITTSPDNSAAVKHTKSNKNKKEKPIKISLPNSEPGYDKDKNIIKRIDLDDGGTTIKEKKIITYHQLNKSF